MRKTNQLPLSLRKTPPSSAVSKTPIKKGNITNNGTIVNSAEATTGTNNNSNFNAREQQKREALHVDLKESDLSDLSDLMKQLNENYASPPSSSNTPSVTPPTSKNPKTSSSEKKVSLTKLLGKSKTITVKTPPQQTSPSSSSSEIVKEDVKTNEIEPLNIIEVEDPIVLTPPEYPTPAYSPPSPPNQDITNIPLLPIPVSIYSQPFQRIEIDTRTDSPPPPLPPDSPMSFALPSPISGSYNPFFSSPIISPRTSKILKEMPSFSPTRAKTPKRNLVELEVSLRSCKKIEKINTLFDQNNDEEYEWNSLCTQIGSCADTLKQIVLKKCCLEDDKHFLTFFESLIENDVQLEVLDLEGNKLTPESCSYLGEYLFMSRDSLKVLNLRNNPLTDEGVWNIVQSYKEASERTGFVSQLRDFDMSGCQVSDEGLLCFALFAKDFLPNLNSLKCFGNCITNINVIRDLVKDNGRLRNVDFWRNSIQVESLARLATNSTNLVSLNLGCNLIGDKGVVVISKYLSFAKNLRCLDLSGNEIRDGGGFHLANGILVNCGLTLLNLGNNFLTENSVSRIIDCIKNHPNLCNLSITRNRINPLRVPDLNKYISDVNAVRKRLDYPVCKTTISTCIEMSSFSPGKSANQTLTNSSIDSYDEEMTFSNSHNTNTPRAITPNFEIEPILSPSLNLSPPVHHNFLSTKSIHKVTPPLDNSRSSLELQEEVETIQEALKTLKQNREARMKEQTANELQKVNESDIDSLSQRDLSSYASRTSLDAKTSGSKFFISLLFYPSSINMIQEKDDNFYLKFFATQIIIKRQRKLFKKTKTVISAEVSETKIELSPQSNAIFTLNIRGESFGIKILSGREQEFIQSFLQHQEMSAFNASHDQLDSDTASTATDTSKAKKSKEFQSPTRRILIDYLKRSSFKQSQTRSSLEVEVSKLVLEYILDILVLDVSPLSSTSSISSPRSSNNSQPIPSVEYQCRNSEGKIDSEKYTDAQQLIARKIYVCVFLQEYSSVLFRNNIPKLYEYLTDLQNIINSGKVDDITYAQLLVTITTMYITHNLHQVNPTMIVNHISSLMQYISKTVNNSQFRLQRQMAADSLQEILYFYHIRITEFIPTVLKCCQTENSHALQSFSTLLANLIYLETNKTKREVVNSLTFLIENIQLFTIWGRAAIFEIISQIIKDTEYPDNVWKRVFRKFKHSINSYLVHIFCHNTISNKQHLREDYALNVDDYSQPLYVREQLIYFQNNPEKIGIKYFDELPIKKEKCKIISTRKTNDMENMLHLLDCVADYRYYMKALSKYYSKSFKQPQIQEESATSVSRIERQLYIRLDIIFNFIYFSYQNNINQYKPTLDFLVDMLERESSLNLLISPVLNYTISLINSLSADTNNELVNGLFDHIVNLPNENLGYYFSLFEALINNLRKDQVTKLLSCLHKFVRSKLIANFGDWHHGDSVLSIIRMVVYRACNEPSCFKNDEVHLEQDQQEISNNILTLLIQDYNSLEIKQRSSFYYNIINQVTNKRKLLGIFGFETDLDIKKDGILGSGNVFELNEPIPVPNILSVSFVKNICHELSLEQQTNPFRVGSAALLGSLRKDDSSHSLNILHFYFEKYLKSFKYQIQLQYKLSPISASSLKLDMDKLVGIELSFGGEDAHRFVGIDNFINIPYIKLPEDVKSITVEESSLLPSDHLFTIKFFPLKPLPGLINVTATFTGIKSSANSTTIEPSTAYCQTTLNDISIEFKDLFLPIFDKDLPDNLTKESLFEAIWNCKDTKIVSSVKVLRNTQVSEVMDSYKLFAVNQNDYIFIFLPPKYHLLIKLTQREENAHLSIKTDYWQVLSLIDEMFQPTIIPKSISTTTLHNNTSDNNIVLTNNHNGSLPNTPSSPLDSVSSPINEDE